MAEELLNEDGELEEQADQPSDEEEACSEAGETTAEDSESESSDEEVNEEEQLDAQFSESQIQGLVEALLFTSGEPIGIGKLRRVTGLPSERLKDILESIQMKFEIEDSGFRLVNAAGRYQFRTDQVFGPFIKKLKEEKPRKLTPAALETLAIVAYRQPIVKSDIEKIRGVDATPTIKTLIERRLIRIVGHQATVGQPALYGTSDTFLKIFGLQSLSELPTLRDLRELEADPGEVEELQSEEAVSESDQDEANLEEEVSDAEETAEEDSVVVELPQVAETEALPRVGNE